jgi:hypothetical protein
MPLKAGSTVQRLGLFGVLGDHLGGIRDYAEPCASLSIRVIFAVLRDPIQVFISRSGLPGLAAQNCSVEPIQSGVGASCAWPWYSATGVLSVSFFSQARFLWLGKRGGPTRTFPLALAGPMLLTRARIVQRVVPPVDPPDRQHPPSSMVPTDRPRGRIGVPQRSNRSSHKANPYVAYERALVGDFHRQGAGRPRRKESGRTPWRPRTAGCSQQLISILLLAWLAAGWLCPIGSFRISLDVGGRSLRRRVGDMEPMQEVLMGRREGPLSSMRSARPPLRS